jgi:hypothetical protein
MNEFDDQTDFSFLGISCEEVVSKPAKTKKNYGTDHVGVTLVQASRKGIPSGRKGFSLSEETKAKIRAARAQQVITAETRAKISAGNKGKVRSAEHIAKYKIASQGRTKNADTRAKISATKNKPVMTPNGVYTSCMAIAEAAGVSRATVYTWMSKYPDHYYYIKDSK